MKTKQIIPQKTRPPSEAASILLIRGSEANSQTTEVIETQRDGPQHEITSRTIKTTLNHKSVQQQKLI